MAGNTEPARAEAIRQVEAGADMLLVNVGAFGIDERAMLPRLVKEIADIVDVPLVIESRNPEALSLALETGCGTPLVNSITGEENVLADVLPVVKKYNTPVVVLATDSAGIPSTPEKRLEILKRIVAKTEAMGIGRERIVADCLAESAGINPKAAETTIKTMQLVKAELGLNLVMGASNISFGLPVRSYVNTVFMALVVSAGLDSAIVNVQTVKPYVLAADLLSGRDPRARRYTAYCRSLKKG
jgi:5-methyltetrahydrofolate--homocysteine methyltransferase